MIRRRHFAVPTLEMEVRRLTVGRELGAPSLWRALPEEEEEEAAVPRCHFTVSLGRRVSIEQLLSCNHPRNIVLVFACACPLFCFFNCFVHYYKFKSPNFILILIHSMLYIFCFLDLT